MYSLFILQSDMLPSLRDIVHPSLLVSSNSLPTYRSNFAKQTPHQLRAPVPPSMPNVMRTVNISHSPPETAPLKRKRVSKLCSEPGCTKRSRIFGKCCAHGGRSTCAHPNCNKCARAGGYCIQHGGGLRCKLANCNKAAQSRGLCYAHREAVPSS